jgi:hypothetical protein
MLAPSRPGKGDDFARREGDGHEQAAENESPFFRSSEAVPFVQQSLYAVRIWTELPASAAAAARIR